MRVACIGSREISEKVRNELRRIGRFIARKGWIVVSGNALGSDEMYVRGANSVDPCCVKLFLPWASYNKELIVPGNVLVLEAEEEWTEIARAHHPKYDDLKQGAQKMMQRNVGIVADADVVLAVLNHKKPGGGGTGQGWRVAETMKKPRLDVSGLENSMKAEEIANWLKFLAEKVDNRRNAT